MPLSMHRLDRVFLAVMVYEGFPAPTDLRAEGGEEPFVGFPVLEKAVLEEEVAAVAESQQVGVMGTQGYFNPLDRFQDEQAELAVEDVEIEQPSRRWSLAGSNASGLCPVAQRESSSRAGDSS